MRMRNYNTSCPSIKLTNSKWIVVEKLIIKKMVSKQKLFSENAIFYGWTEFEKFLVYIFTQGILWLGSVNYSVGSVNRTEKIPACSHLQIKIHFF